MGRHTSREGAEGRWERGNDMFGITQKTTVSAPVQRMAAPAKAAPAEKQAKMVIDSYTRADLAKLTPDDVKHMSTKQRDAVLKAAILYGAQDAAANPNRPKPHLGMGDHAFWANPNTYRQMNDSSFWRNPDTYRGHGY